jgi:hypothetical protein
MSLEQALNENTATMKQLIAALAAAGTVSAASTGTAADAGAATTTKTSTAKGKTKTAEKAGPTREEMVAALTEVKEKFGAAEAKAIISKAGAAKMAEIADDKIAATFTLAKAKLEASSADETDPEDDGL